MVQSIPKEENPDLPGQWELFQFRGLLFEFSNAVAGPAWGLVLLGPLFGEFLFSRTFVSINPQVAEGENSPAACQQ